MQIEHLNRKRRLWRCPRASPGNLLLSKSLGKAIDEPCAAVPFDPFDPTAASIKSDGHLLAVVTEPQRELPIRFASITRLIPPKTRIVHEHVPRVYQAGSLGD